MPCETPCSWMTAKRRESMYRTRTRQCRFHLSKNSFSPLHQVYFANVDRVAFAINRDNHCQSDRCFGCCNGDNENSENLPCQVGGPGLDGRIESKAHKRDIHGVEHDFYAHQYRNGIAFSNSAIKPDTKK